MLNVLLILVLTLSIPTDSELLASLITSECSICSESEQYLVGSVVLNRVDSKDFPATLKKVIFQDNQFHGSSSKWFTPTEQTTKVADNLLRGEGRYYEILYFYSPSKAKNKAFVKRMAKFVKFKKEYHDFATAP